MNVNSSKGSKGHPKKSFNKQKGRSDRLVNNRNIPSAYVSTNKNKKPIYRTLKDGSIDVEHTELFYSITAGNWASKSALKYWDINPGNALLFPWLARIANAYERYKFKKFEVIYQPQVGTSDTGTQCMAIDFDVSDDIPSSFIELNSYEGAVLSQTFCKNRLSYPQKRLNSFLSALYVAKQGSSGTEPRTSFMGKLLVATDSAATTVGHLKVKYVVNLSIPEGRGVVQLFDRYSSTVDPLIISSRRFVNSPSPTATPKPFVSYFGINQITYDSPNGRYTTQVTNGDPGTWNLLMLDVTGTSLGAMTTTSVGQCTNLFLKFASVIASGSAAAVYYLYYKRKDPAVPSNLRIDLFDVTVALATVNCQIMSVSDDQPNGTVFFHGALTSLTV